MTTTVEAHEREQRPLRRAEKRRLAVLGVPTFGLALSITVVSTYLPVLAREFTGSTAIIGLLVATEGVLALALPVVVGTWSDTLRTRLGGRLPFVVAGVPFVALALATMGFLHSIGAIAVAVTMFYAAYFTCYEPYRALYPDLVDDRIAGRAQSTQALWRGAGTGLALVAGGLLFSVWHPLPFVGTAVVLLAAVALFLQFILRAGPPAQEPAELQPHSRSLREVAGLVRDHPALRSFMVANALWELSLAALKTFVVLFITVGLGKNVSTASLLIAAASAFIVLAAAVSGKLGDRLGKARVMQVAVVVFGTGLLVPGITQSAYVVVPLMPVIAFGGGVLLTLPYAILMPMMPDAHHGTVTGLYSLSRGVGIMLGPLLAGGAIQLGAGPLSSTHGYAAMWLVCGAAVLASLPALTRLRRHDDDREALEPT